MMSYALLNLPSHLILCFCIVLDLTQVHTYVPCKFAESTCNKFPFITAQKHRKG